MLDAIARGEPSPECLVSEIEPEIWLYSWRVSGRSVIACFGTRQETVYLLLIRAFTWDTEVRGIVNEAKQRLLSIESNR